MSGEVAGVDGVDYAIALCGHAVAETHQFVISGHLFDEVARVRPHHQLPAVLLRPFPTRKHLQKVDSEGVGLGWRLGDEGAWGAGHEGDDFLGFCCVDEEGQESQDGICLEFYLPALRGLQRFVVLDCEKWVYFYHFVYKMGQYLVVVFEEVKALAQQMLEFLPLGKLQDKRAVLMRQQIQHHHVILKNILNQIFTVIFALLLLFQSHCQTHSHDRLSFAKEALPNHLSLVGRHL